jgi:hypothetical protein
MAHLWHAVYPTLARRAPFFTIFFMPQSGKLRIQGYLQKKVYYHTAGNGIRLMAKSNCFGVFYDRSGTVFHLLYDFDHRFTGLAA